MTGFLIVLLSLLPFQDQDVPYLPQDEFTYEVDYFLKRKPVNSEQIYDASGRSTRQDRDVLPYVRLHFTFTQFRDSDRRIEIYHGKNRRNSKKIKGPMKITLDMGYAVDMKEGVTDATFTILLINDDKEPRAQVLVRVQENGELYINEVRSGMI